MLVGILAALLSRAAIVFFGVGMNFLRMKIYVALLLQVGFELAPVRK